MNLKIPPVVLVLIIAVSMWAFNKLTGLSYASENLLWISKGLFGMCVIVLLFALYAFWKLKTTVDPMNLDKVSNLVTVGIYHVSRNPMYLAMLLLLTGWGVKLGNPLNLLLLIFFVWFMTKFQIKPEEETLTKIFGEDFLNYCKKVRRWI